MLKKNFCLLLTILAVSLLADVIGPEFHSLPTSKKCQDKGLTFLASFDSFNVNADFAKGNKLALTCPDISLSLRGQYGFDSNQAYKPEAAEELVYDIAGNLIPEQGTLSFWVRIDDFDPMDPKVVNAGVYRIFVRNGESWTENFAYISKGKLYFCNHFGTGSTPLFGSFGANISLENIRKGQWFQVTTTWDNNSCAFYLNGKQIGKGTTPKPLKPGPGSFMGFSCRVWWQFGHNSRKYPLALDDIKVYDFCMSDILVHKKYNDLLKSPEKLSKLLALNVSGKGMGSGKLPLLRLDIDARAIDNATNAEYCVEGPGVKQTGTVPLKNGTAELLFKVPASGGKYVINTKVKNHDETTKINVPDCSFALQPPEQLTIPYPWTKPVFDSRERSVKVWNRKYVFGKSPFPVKVMAGKHELLSKPPVLLAEGQPVNWSAGNTETTDLGFILHGTGRAGKLNFTYKTLIEYDGMIKVDFKMSARNQTFNSLNLKWQVARPFCSYLMTPRYFNGNDDELAFGFPVTPFRTHFMIWLVSEKAGFCWIPENDANWENVQPDRAIRVNRKNGKCSVSLISKKVVLNGDYNYSMFFAATPTRLPKWSPNSEQRAIPHIQILQYWGGKNYISFDYDEIMLKNYAGAYRDKIIAPYGMGHGQMSSTPVAAYLQKSWDLPGGHIYKMGHVVPNHKTGKYDFIRRTPTTNVCAQGTNFTDFISANISKLLAHKYGSRFRMLYFDLGSVSICRNQEHGCGFKDRFGKSVGTLTVMGMRRFYQRMVQIARKHNIPVMTHGQDCFVPIVNGIADYWFPGEQFEAFTRREQFGYTDKIPDGFFRTEANKSILGCNVIFLSKVPPDNSLQFRLNANEALLTMLLPHDIDWSEIYERITTRKVKEILRHYRLEDPSVVAHLYYNQDAISSSDPRIWVTWYDCPNGYKLMILANRHKKDITTHIDLSKFKLANSVLKDEYTNQSYKLKNGILEIPMRNRSFAIFGLPSKPWLPLRDGFKEAWLRYLNNNVQAAFGDIGHMNFWNDEGVFHAASPAMRIPPLPEMFLYYASVKLPKNWRHTFVRLIPVESGKKYRMSIWGRSSNLPTDAEVRVCLQPLKNFQSRIGKPIIIKPKHPNLENWEELSTTIEVPPNAVWLQVELEALNAGKAKVWFDDFYIAEVQGSSQ